MSKEEVERLTGKAEEGQKALQAKGDLEEKVHQLEMIIDMTAKEGEQQRKAEEKSRAEIDKLRELQRLEKELNQSNKAELERLRDVEKETFIMKQELVRISAECKGLREEKEQMPIMLDKFEHQEHIIADLKEKIKENEAALAQKKTLVDTLEKRAS